MFISCPEDKFTSVHSWKENTDPKLRQAIADYNVCVGLLKKVSGYGFANYQNSTIRIATYLFTGLNDGVVNQHGHFEQLFCHELGHYVVCGPERRVKENYGLSFVSNSMEDFVEEVLVQLFHRCLLAKHLWVDDAYLMQESYIRDFENNKILKQYERTTRNYWGWPPITLFTREYEEFNQKFIELAKQWFVDVGLATQDHKLIYGALNQTGDESKAKLVSLMLEATGPRKSKAISKQLN